MKTRLISLILAVFMIVGIMASCTKGDDNGNAVTDPNNAVTDPKSGVTDQNNGETTTEATPGSGSVTDVVTTGEYMNDVSFPNEKINVLYWENVNNVEFDVQVDDGSPINSAIFRRDSRVQSKLGIEIVWTGTPGSKAVFKTFVQNNINDGLQVLAGHSMSMGTVAAAGLLHNLREVEHFNWDSEWWPTNLIKDATINDRLYFCSGDISNNSLLAMITIFFNKGLSETNFYEYVDNGTWTFDRFIKETENMYENRDSNPEKSIGDKFGYVSWWNVMNSVFVGMGIRIVERNNDGELALSPTYATEKTQGLLETINDNFYNGNDWYYDSDFDSSAEIFTSGRTLFYSASVRFTINKLADSGVTYGVLPNPKYNEEQENYYTLLANTYTLYGVVNAVDEKTLDMCGAFIEYMAYESYNIVTPVVFETTLKARYADKPDDARMFDIIRNALVMEVGLIFSDDIASGLPSKGLFTMIDGNKSTWMSYIAGKETSIKTSFRALNKSFSD